MLLLYYVVRRDNIEYFVYYIQIRPAYPIKERYFQEYFQKISMNPVPYYLLDFSR